MNMTSTIPKQHISACHTIYVPSQILIWTKYNRSIFRKTFDYLASITAGHYNISQSFCSCTRIHITYYCITCMFLQKITKFFCWTTLCQRTCSFQVRNQYFLVRTKNLICFSHEMHATHHYDLCICFCSFLSQCQTVAYKVCYVLNFAICIIMCHDYSILFLTHTTNLFLYINSFRNRFVYKTFFLILLNIHILYILFYFLFIEDSYNGYYRVWIMFII